MRTASAALLAWLMWQTIPSLAQDAAATEGKALYTSYQCWQCHGYEGQGGAAKAIVPVVYPFEAFVRYIRFPDLMPAYSPDNLSDDALRKIYDYVKAIPEPPQLDAIPPLRPEASGD